MDVAELAGEKEVRYFDLLLPLPYRVALSLVLGMKGGEVFAEHLLIEAGLGIWAWGANLQYLSHLKIDVPSLIRHQHGISPRSSLSEYLSTYRLALVVSIPLLFSLILFWPLTHLNATLVLYYNFFPVVYLAFVIGVFCLPARGLAASGRSQFLNMLRRISIGGLAQSKNMKFADILLADVLTSYSKVLSDFFAAIWALASSTLGTGDAYACAGRTLVPLITAIPPLIRFRQCLTEYLRLRTSGGSESGGQHLANALKYASAFPIIFLTPPPLGQQAATLEEGSRARQLLSSGWLLAVLLNSLYSFYWDVARDWDLTLFSSLAQSVRTLRPLSRRSQTQAKQSPSFPFGLRSQRWFPRAGFYYFAILLDLTLRSTWILKVSPYAEYFGTVESGMMLLVWAEIFRRWVWLFLRLETEWIRRAADRAHEALNATELEGEEVMSRGYV
ncbi:putative protein-ER retention protein (Erd1)/putative EXS family protein [Blumeria hordei DH14]|uniref:EXS domain-containing protein n=1 Tax=Blumeria graminis f. sp. hordei (strain DH14) TaxID=546991 RepID=N1JAN5_BLUG1|nr:putative protein-ER retention protein (Erd1)/putative EXS family protein [Blumeria hordei DH14]